MNTQLRWLFAMTAWMPCILLQPSRVCGMPILWTVSCEYESSNGVHTYTYKVKNTGAIPLTLDQFSVGTDDPVFADYKPIFAPPDFVFTLDAEDQGMHTTGQFTEHGSVSPGGQWMRSTKAVARWTHFEVIPASYGAVATDVVAPGEVLTFAFSNVHAGQDAEWLISGNPLSQKAIPSLPVTGPAGFFGAGPVHAPTPEPASLVLLSAGLLLILRRRRRFQ